MHDIHAWHKTLYFFTCLLDMGQLISNNALSDSSFLKELKLLEKLDVSNNQFEELALGSINLKHVDVRENKLSSLDFVLPLKSLRSLNLRANNIQVIS